MSKIDLDKQIPNDLAKQAFRDYNGKCYYCGLDMLSSLSLFWSYEIDHVIARSEGGLNTIDNVVLSCRSCNGTLNRTGHLKTKEERRAYVQREIQGRAEIYEAWIERLRGDKQVNYSVPDNAEICARCTQWGGMRTFDGIGSLVVQASQAACLLQKCESPTMYHTCASFTALNSPCQKTD